LDAGLDLLNRPGEQAELVALRVAEDNPADIGLLADVDTTCPEAQQSLQFLRRRYPVCA
jgi:hypothetical protein